MSSSQIISPWQKERTERSEREQQKRTAIFHTAALAFANKGYHETSMDDIADLLGITKPTLYKYYKNKAELLTACQEEAVKKFLPIAQEALSLPGTAQEKLQYYFLSSLRETTTGLGKALYLIDRRQLDADLEDSVKNMRREVSQVIRRIIADGIENGEISKSCEPKLASLAFFGAFNFVSRWYQPDGEFTIDQINEQFFNMFFDGIKP